jgi:hypothetical protein
LIDIVAEYKNNLHKVVLHCLNKKNKYMVHLSEEERLQERAEGKQKGEMSEAAGVCSQALKLQKNCYIKIWTLYLFLL